jgi:hypothetical protein
MTDTLVPMIEMSDLFFNHQHANWNALDFAECSLDDQKAAILADAHAFVENYPVVCDGYNALWLADEFMRRV